MALVIVPMLLMQFLSLIPNQCHRDHMHKNGKTASQEMNEIKKLILERGFV